MRVLCAPVTFTTGVWPRRPQVRPLGGLKPWPDSSSKTSQAPRSAAALTGNNQPQLGTRQRTRAGDGGRAYPWSGSGGRGDGDGQAERLELADVVADLLVLVGAAGVVIGAEV